MKKNLLFISFLTLLSCGLDTSESEFERIVIDDKLNKILFTSTDYILNPLTLKTEFGYDNYPDSTQYLVTSNAIVNNDSLRLMRFAKLKRISSDTLELRVFETNPAYIQNLTIKIIDQKFSMEFDYLNSGPPMKPEIDRLKQSLTVKSIPKQKGEMIFGTFYFKGICSIDCKGEIEIMGDFKAELE